MTQHLPCLPDRLSAENSGRQKVVKKLSVMSFMDSCQYTCCERVSPAQTAFPEETDGGVWLGPPARQVKLPPDTASHTAAPAHSISHLQSEPACLYQNEERTSSDTGSHTAAPVHSISSLPSESIWQGQHALGAHGIPKDSELDHVKPASLTSPGPQPGQTVSSRCNTGITQ